MIDSLIGLPSLNKVVRVLLYDRLRMSGAVLTSCFPKLLFFL